MPEIFFVENPVGADGSGGRFELADPPNVATRDPAWWEEGELGTGDRVGPGCRTEKLEGSSAPRPWKSPHSQKVGSNSSGMPTQAVGLQLRSSQQSLYDRRVMACHIRPIAV